MVIWVVMLISNRHIQMVSSSISIIIVDITPAMVRVVDLNKARHVMVWVLMMMGLRMILRSRVRMQVSHHLVQTQHSNLRYLNVIK